MVEAQLGMNTENYISEEIVTIYDRLVDFDLDAGGKPNVVYQIETAVGEKSFSVGKFSKPSTRHPEGSLTEH